MDNALMTLIDRVRGAAADRTALRIVGHATHTGLLPAIPGLRCQATEFAPDARPVSLLQTSEYTGVVSYEPSELVVTVRAGTPLRELESLLARQGQCLAFEPPYWGAKNGMSGGTVGGMVAAGLSGPSRASVGAVRDYMLGLEMINGVGECLRFGGQVMKNVAGYDVSRLMTGSWGTLGVLTEVSLKVLPQAPAEATLRMDCSQAQALKQLNAWGAQPLPLNASTWLPVDQEADTGQLYVRLRGARAAVESAIQRLGGVLLAPEAAQTFWDGCRHQQASAWQPLDPSLDRASQNQPCLWRLSVPDTTPVLNLPVHAQCTAVEWHGALRWVWADIDDAPALHRLAAQHRGSASVFRVGGAHETVVSKAFDLESKAQPAARALIEKRLRHAFDPHGVFAPENCLHCAV